MGFGLCGVFVVLCVASSCVVCDVCRVWCDMSRVWCIASSAMFVHHVFNLFRVFERKFLDVCFNVRFPCR